jgi:hypothetical protein
MERTHVRRYEAHESRPRIAMGLLMTRSHARKRRNRQVLVQPSSILGEFFAKKWLAMEGVLS